MTSHDQPRIGNDGLSGIYIDALCTIGGFECLGGPLGALQAHYGLASYVGKKLGDETTVDQMASKIEPDLHLRDDLPNDPLERMRIMAEPYLHSQKGREHARGHPFTQDEIRNLLAIVGVEECPVPFAARLYFSMVQLVERTIRWAQEGDQDAVRHAFLDRFAKAPLWTEPAPNRTAEIQAHKIVKDLAGLLDHQDVDPQVTMRRRLEVAEDILEHRERAHRDKAKNAAIRELAAMAAGPFGCTLPVQLKFVTIAIAMMAERGLRVIAARSSPASDAKLSEVARADAQHLFRSYKRTLTEAAVRKVLSRSQGHGS